VLAALLTGGLALLVAAFRTSPPAPAPAFVPAALPSVRPATLAPPALPRAGGVSAAIWARSDAPPVAPVDLVQAAGVPAVVVRTAGEAFAHPLVVVWPDAALVGSELEAARAYEKHGGRLLVVAPDAPTDRQAAVTQLRTLWSKVDGGFLLADVPGGKPSGLVVVHDVRSTAAALAAPAFVLDERARGVGATYGVQGDVLSAADGPLAAAQAQAALGEVRERGGELVAAGLTGAPLHSQSDAGVLVELRRGMSLVGGLTGLAPTTVRAVRGAGDRVAAGEQSAGVTLDASLDTPGDGPSPPFQASTAAGVRPVLRIPTVTDVSSAGTAVVAGPTTPLEPRLRAADALLGRASADAWLGTLGAYGEFWRDRRSLAVDVRQAQAGEPGSGWFVRLAAPRTVTDQALVAPFDVAFAATGTGRALQVAADRRTIVLPAFRTLLVQVAEQGGGG
jgi:hypothetical protein